MNVFRQVSGTLRLGENSHLVGVDPDGNPEGPSETKVGQFDDSFVVDEEVLGLQVPVEDSATVAEVDALQDLVQVALTDGEG